VTEPASKPDPELVGQWVAIAAMLASAQELHARGGGGWPPLAVIAADTACEAVLAMAAAKAPKPAGPEARWPELFSAAVVAFRDVLGHPMRDGLMRRLKTLHEQRNAAVHDGTDPGPRAIDAALETAAELRNLAVDGLELLEAFRDGGPSAVVARVIDIDPVSRPLREAEEHLGRDELEPAADRCAVALHEALERVKPGLETYRTPTSTRAPDRADQVFGILRDQARLHQAWILAFGLGLRPIELARLQRLLGEPDDEGVYRAKGVTLDRAGVQWAVRTTTDVIFRLWLSESLAPRPWPWLEDDDDDEEGDEQD